MTLKQKILLSLATVGILSTAFLIVFGESGLNDYNRLNFRREQLVGENEAIIRENARLYHQIERLKNDPEFIESIARQELGMIGRKEFIIKPMRPVGGKVGVGRPVDLDANRPAP
jgi:cell division protein FtsB